MAPPLGAQAAALGAHAARSARLARDARSRTSIMERYYNFGGEGIARGRRGRRRTRARGQRAGHRLSRLGQGAARSRAHRRADAPLARAHLRARRPHRHAERGDPAAGTRRRERSSSSSGAPTPSASGPDAPGPLPFTRPAGDASRCSPARFAAGTARSTSCARCASCARAGRTDIGAVFDRRRPGAAGACEAEAAGLAERRLHRRRAARRRCRRASPPPTSASRRSTSARTRPLSLGFYWSPLKIFEYMAAGLPVVAPARRRIPSLVGRRPRRAALRPGAARRRSPTRSTRADAIRPLARAARRAPRASAPSREYSWAGALRRARRARSAKPETAASAQLDVRMNVLLATDCVPARLRRQRLEHVRARARAARARPRRPRRAAAAGRRRTDVASATYDGFRVLEFGVAGAAAAVRRNYFKNERLYAALATSCRTLIARERDRHRPRPARADVPAVDRGRAPRTASRRSARCATTGRSATGRI